MSFVSDFNRNIESLKKDSPLINWLLPKMPLLIQSALMSFLIVWLTSTMLEINAQPEKLFRLTVPLFVIITVITNYSPKTLDPLQYGLGFALATVIFRFAWLNALKAK
jgi:hypothetical protein